jgi:hypothetical protein
MIDDLNTTARTLGYLTLLIWVICIICVTLMVSRRIVHDWRKKRYKEKMWDNRQSEWMFRQKTGDPQRYDTDTLDFTIEEVYDYSKEQYRDAS